VKKIYLTIDDIPSVFFDKKIDFLYENKIPALLFCQGNMIENKIDKLVESIKRGYVLCNHSFSHPHFSDLSIEQCYSEINRTDRIIQKLYDEAGMGWEKKYFRFPYFDRGGNSGGVSYEKKESATNIGRIIKIQDILKDLGYVKPDFKDITYGWYHEESPVEYIDTFCTFDQAEYFFGNANAPSGLNDENSILKRIEADLPAERMGLNSPGSSEIILIHDHDYTNDLFFKCIRRYAEKEFEFVLP
jgi:peptidoglycan-N-acetylglucosamine deacetylase